MRLLLSLFLLIPFGLNAATTFTEFYCDSGVGTNINAGSTTNAAATYTSVNGGYAPASDTFTPTDGSTPASTVSVGDWASVYVDGATNAVYIAKIVTVNAGVNGTIVLSTTAFMGTEPSNSANGRSIKVGGAWNGPYGTIGFPFGFLATTATNAPNVFPRCNFKNTAQYNITAAITHANVGPILFQGMSLAPGDLGKATIDGGATGTSYVLLTVSGANNDLADLIFANNGNSGSASGISLTGGEINCFRVVVHDIYRSGFSVGSSGAFLFECEAYACNKNNSAGHAGYLLSGGPILFRCISHDNTGNNNSGFITSSVATFINCISESNGKEGIVSSATTGVVIKDCDTYNNSGSGLDLTATSPIFVIVENSNFVKNGAYGIVSSGSSLRNGSIFNCGFGSGTMTNASGSMASSISALNEIGSVIYASDQTPWTDPANGDFRISLTAAKSAGRGLFTETAASYTGTIAYPDIGAAQSASTNAAAAGGTTAHTFAQ